MKLSVIIPLFNEENTIVESIKRVLLSKLAREIIVVNDASTDNSKEKVEEFIKKSKGSIKLLNHTKNKGKGAAIKTGLEEVNGDYVIIHDADLEYDPQDWPKMAKPVKDGKAKVVYGSRFTGEHRDMFFKNWVANQFLNLLINILYDTTISDMETCYKLIPTKLMRSLNLKAKRFDFEPEVTSKILRSGIRIYEVPISYAGREYKEGKKITWKDGIHAIFSVFKYRFFD